MSDEVMSIKEAASQAAMAYRLGYNAGFDEGLLAAAGRSTGGGFLRADLRAAFDIGRQSASAVPAAHRHRYTWPRLIRRPSNGR